MGEAKRRGTREQRVAQAIERNKVEDAKREAERIARAAERRERAAERQRLLNTQERKEGVMLVGGGHDPALLRAVLAGALAAAAPVLAVDTSRVPSTRATHK